MPRSKKVEACLFCEEVPCTCYTAPPKQKRTSSRTKPRESNPQSSVETPVRTKVSKVSVREAMKEAAKAEPPSPPPRPHPTTLTARTQPTKREQDYDSEEILFAAALRSLRPILHAESISRFKMLITSVPSASERAAVWRARREVGND